MASLTTQQMAELLVGIARAQQAVVDAVESQKPGFRMTHFGPALLSTAKIRNTTHAPTLADFPARLLLAHQGRNPPDLAQVVRDLDALLSGAPPAAAATPAPAADAGSLDMTQP